MEDEDKKPTVFQVMKARINTAFIKATLQNGWGKAAKRRRRNERFGFWRKNGRNGTSVLEYLPAVNLTCFEQSNRWLKACRKNA